MIAPSDQAAGLSTAYRVVLLGGKALAIECLDSLLRMRDVDVAAVIPCADDEPAGGHWYPCLAGRAKELGLPVFQPKSVNEAEFLPILRQLEPHLLVSVFYDKILKPRVLEIPSLAAANVHFGLLPYNRGSMPIPWAIIDGNDPGVTMHHMDPGVDTGDIIAQMAVPAGDHETAKDIYGRCTAAGLYLFERYIPLLLQSSAPRRCQPTVGGSYYRPGYPFDRWIEWSQPGEEISRFVRALTFAPFPSARTSFAGSELEVCHPVWIASDGTRWPAGNVMDMNPHWVTIATGNGSLSVRTIRLEGSELPAAEALGEVGCSIGSMLDSKR